MNLRSRELGLWRDSCWRAIPSARIFFAVTGSRIGMSSNERLAASLSDRYRVERELGAGGMATVYLAEDLRHDRKVAIKVLKPELAAVLGAERFVVEIKTTASLQHPHILPLFDSGTADGFLFYVMPYIQGETIREKLNRETQFGVDEAVRIAREVADALDYAHRRGVIHRDIKPENILLHDGRAMVMDFGIALAVSAAAGGRMTETGLSLGTPHYMSPEQATAEKEISGRSDVYSLASVLYEMLAGVPPHLGGSAQQVIAKIIAEPAQLVTQHRRTVPEHVAESLDRALEKLPADRFATAKEFAQALAGEISPGRSASGRGSPSGQRLSSGDRGSMIRRALRYGAASAVLALGAWGWLRSPPEVRPRRARFVIDLPDSIRISSTLGQGSLVLSRDGSEFVYPTAWGGGWIMRRRLDDLTATPVPESQGALNPRYSPDGQWLLLQRGSRDLIRVPLAGGPPVHVADSSNRASWGDDGSIVFTKGRALWRLGPGERTATQLTFPSDSGEVHLWPHVLPGGAAVLFEFATLDDRTTDDDELAVVRVKDGSITRLGHQGSNPRYVQSGHLLYTRQDGTVSAVVFDVRRLEATGVAVTVLDGVFVKQGGAGMYSVSDDGTLVYTAGSADVNLIAVNRDGRTRRLTAMPSGYRHPRVSPSGDRIAFTRAQNGKIDVWVIALATGQEFRLTRDGMSSSPEWSANGDHVIWISGDSSGPVLLQQRADGRGTPRQVGRAGVSLSVSRVGEVAAVVTGRSQQRDISLVRLNGDTVLRSLIDGPAQEVAPMFSPDGRWLAYQSNESGRDEVYVASVADPGVRVQVSVSGGIEPAWAPDGRSLYFRAAGTVVSASMVFAPLPETTGRAVLFNSPYLLGANSRWYDVNRSTGELVFLERGSSETERVVVVLGWLEELKERMAAASR